MAPAEQLRAGGPRSHPCYGGTEKLNVLVRFRVRRKGLYAIAGLEVDHPVGGGPCRSTMYGASMACAHVRCGDDVERAVIDRIESLAGFP